MQLSSSHEDFGHHNRPHYKFVGSAAIRVNALWVDTLQRICVLKIQLLQQQQCGRDFKKSHQYAVKKTKNKLSCSVDFKLATCQILLQIFPIEFNREIKQQ